MCRAGLPYRPCLEILEYRDLPSISITVPVLALPGMTTPTTSPPAAGGGQTSRAVSQQVLQFAHAHLGSRVGDGQCTTLVVAALEHAGARTTYDYGVSGLTADYIWGRLVGQYRAASHAGTVQPGDILQFRNVVTVARTAGAVVTLSLPHHTAIVSQNLGGGRLVVLEQNVAMPGRSAAQVQTVQLDVLELSQLTQGTVRVYRPVSR
jgi:hypothetical protein